MTLPEGIELLEEWGHDYKCKFCGKHDYVLRRNEKDSIEAAEQHAKYCHMNPQNQMCGSCDHFRFAKKLTPKDDDYDYGIPEQINKNLRLCNYVGLAVHGNCGCCKNHKQKKEGAE